MINVLCYKRVEGRVMESTDWGETWTSSSHTLATLSGLGYTYRSSDGYFVKEGDLNNDPCITPGSEDLTSDETEEALYLRNAEISEDFKNNILLKVDSNCPKLKAVLYKDGWFGTWGDTQKGVSDPITNYSKTNNLIFSNMGLENGKDYFVRVNCYNEGSYRVTSVKEIKTNTITWIQTAVGVAVRP